MVEAKDTPKEGEMDLGTIGSVKNSTSEVKVAIREWQGNLGVDLRRYNNQYPTVKGIRLRPSEIPETITFLERAEQELKKRGIIT